MQKVRFPGNITLIDIMLALHKVVFLHASNWIPKNCAVKTSDANSTSDSRVSSKKMWMRPSEIRQRRAFRCTCMLFSWYCTTRSWYTLTAPSMISIRWKKFLRKPVWIQVSGNQREIRIKLSSILNLWDNLISKILKLQVIEATDLVF